MRNSYSISWFIFISTVTTLSLKDRNTSKVPFSQHREAWEGWYFPRTYLIAKHSTRYEVASICLLKMSILPFCLQFYQQDQASQFIHHDEKDHPKVRNFYVQPLSLPNGYKCQGQMYYISVGLKAWNFTCHVDSLPYIQEDYYSRFFLSFFQKDCNKSLRKIRETVTQHRLQNLKEYGENIIWQWLAC